MNSLMTPISPNIWSEGPNPQLLGGRSADGRIVFPIPDGDAAKDLELIKLSPVGTLWSFTRQDFKPKPPYDGPEEFEPFLLGYIELPGQVIVESHIVETRLEALKLGMNMELVITAFDDTRSTFAFRPEQATKGK